MEIKNKIIGILFVSLFLAGVLFAVSGAYIGTPANTRWTAGVTAASLSTTGGNITAVNVNTTSLTTKWASFSGNLTGTIVLGNSTANVYTWVSTISTGEVCISTNSSVNVFTGLGNSSNTSQIDAAFSTSGTPDNAAGTFNNTCPPAAESGGLSMVVNSVNFTGFTASKVQGSSTFYTCAANLSGNTTQGAYVFCSGYNSSGTNYLGNGANYEIIAPASGTMTYYFYAELS